MNHSNSAPPPSQFCGFVFSVTAAVVVVFVVIFVVVIVLVLPAIVEVLVALIIFLVSLRYLPYGAASADASVVVGGKRAREAGGV